MVIDVVSLVVAVAVVYGLWRLMKWYINDVINKETPNE